MEHGKLASYKQGGCRCEPCRGANAEAQRRYYTPELRRRSKLKSLYNLSEEDYDVMFDGQGGTCAICHQPPESGRFLYVDHDHACCPGQKSCGDCVRGLLCSGCNSLLGYAQDDIDILDSAKAYLAHSPLVG